MGLFQSRPEQPQDWGGLPAEPYDPQFDTARLDDVPDISSVPVSGLLGATETVTIAFTVEPAEPAEPVEPAEPGAPAGDGG